MKDKDTILNEISIAMDKYDLLPSGHQMRSMILEKINTLRWVLDMPPIYVRPGGDLQK